MVGGRTSESSHFPLNLRHGSSVSDVAEQLQAAKRKFQRVNQEIVKQNVALHEQLAKTKQEHHLIMQENIRLKGKIVALESKLAESEAVLIETKKSIAERMDMLEAVGMHLIDVTKFLRIISDPPADEKENEKFDLPDKTPPKHAKPAVKRHAASHSLRSIKEEEPHTVNDLSENVADFSLDRM